MDLLRHRLRLDGAKSGRSPGGTGRRSDGGRRVRIGETDPAFARSFAEHWVAAWNSHEAEQLLALCTEDIVWHDPDFPEPLHGHAAVRDYLERTWRGFPDLAFSPVGAPYVNSDRGTAALHWRVTGTMLGPLEPPRLAPTGRRLEGDGVDLYEFRGELLAVYRAVYDLSSWMRSMGVLPERGGRAERMGAFMQRTSMRLRRGGRS